MALKPFVTIILLLSVLGLTSCAGEKTETPVAPASEPVKGDPLASAPAGGKESTANQAETVGPVLRAFCDAMTKKDEAALRAVYSSSSLKDLDSKIRAAGVKTIVEYLEAEQISNKLCEVRNEVVTGSTATAEIRTEGAPNGFKVKLVKEGDAWKLTNESPELDAVSGGGSR